MTYHEYLTRRRLSARFAWSVAVFGAFLLPPLLQDAISQPRNHLHRPVIKHAARHNDANRPMIVLDPGHGGKDPGAIGVSGIYEKHVTLAAAVELRRLLLASGRYRVALTRSRDVFIPLEQRVAIARQHNAALLVSIHADAMIDRSVRGASVYTKSFSASDPQTAGLMQRENRPADFKSRRHRHRNVHEVVSGLVRQRTAAASVSFANSLVESLNRDLLMLPMPKRHADFIVLQAAGIPSVLVEMGFLTNPGDEAALRRPAYRRLVAKAMYRAVGAWFTSNAHVARDAGSHQKG